MARKLSRRTFGKSLAAGGISASFFVGSAAAATEDQKLRIAGVGVANKGRHNLDQLTSEDMVALCDVDENFLNKCGTAFPKAKKFTDYRQMLDKMHNEIDAVVVSTADHMHAPITSAALEMGKHVYCEKPLTHTVAEARAITQLAAKQKVATQMGTQIHASDNYRRVVELVKSGAIGKVTEVYNWCNKGWSNGRFKKNIKGAPAHLDWNLWLGAAKKRDYCDSIHPANWRRFWEYGSGTFGDMACHIMDLPFWALDLKYPTSVVAKGPEVHPDGAPSNCKATYEFPLEGSDESLKFYWADGGDNFEKVKTTMDYGGNPLSKWGLGVLFVGEKGMLAADYGRRQLLPKDKYADFEAPEQTIKKSVGHWKEWTNACKTGSPTTCTFDYAGPMTETVLLGIVAFRSGEKVMWDAENLKASSENAQQYVSKKYRKGFEVAGVKS